MARLPNFGLQTFFSLTGINGPWTKVTDVKTFGPVAARKPEIDITALDDVVKQYTGGLPDGQEWTLDMMQNDAAPEQQTLVDTFDGDATVYFRLRDPRIAVTDELAFGFATLGKEFSFGENEAAKMVKLTGRISGALVKRAKTAV